MELDTSTISKNKLLNLELRMTKNIRARDFKNRTVYRVQHPFKPFRSRKYGYKSKPGFVVVIASIKKGGVSPFIPNRGRTPSKIYSKYSRNISKYDICANKVKKEYKNLQILGGYLVYQNGQCKKYEFILKDPALIK